MQGIHNSIGHFAWITETLSEILRICPDSLTIQLKIHITQPISLPDIDGIDIPTLGSQEQSAPPSPSSLSEKKFVLEPSLCLEVKSTRGRPDIPSLLEEEITTASGPVSVDGKIVRSLCIFSPLTMLNCSCRPFSACAIGASSTSL